jgi:hypothetical protein
MLEISGDISVKVIYVCIASMQRVSILHGENRVFLCKRGGAKLLCSMWLAPDFHPLTRSDALVPEAINNHVIISNTPPSVLTEYQIELNPLNFDSTNERARKAVLNKSNK